MCVCVCVRAGWGPQSSCPSHPLPLQPTLAKKAVREEESLTSVATTRLRWKYIREPAGEMRSMEGK